MAVIQTQLQDALRKVFANPMLEIRDEMTAQDVPEWDSLNHVMVIVEVEKTFNVRFSTAEVSRLQNIGDLKLLIEKKLPQE